MKKRTFSFCLCTVLLILGTGCGKELSYQVDNTVTGNSGVTGGTLMGSPGACINTVISGSYGQSLPLDSTHRIIVGLDVPRAGTYQLRSDTVNGMYFTGSAVATGTGLQQIQLRGYGTPAAAGQFTFTIRSATSNCSVVVEVFPLAPGRGNDFFPMTTNSRWTYRSNDPLANTGDTLLQMSTGLQRQLIGTGTIYQVFSLNYGGLIPDSAYYRKAGTEYAEYGEIDVSGSGDSSSAADYIFLKEAATPGAEWFSPEVNNKVGGNPVKFRLKFKIIEKNGTAFVGSMVFANVIKVRVIQQAQLSPIAPWSDVLSYETWFAQGIGLINVAAPAPLYGYKVIKYNVL